MTPEQKRVLDELDATHRDDWQEFWWIYSSAKEEWGGLRIASFVRSKPNDIEVLVIMGEIDKRRVGLRVWEDIRVREQWVKVLQIQIPSMALIKQAIAEDLRSR